MPPPRKPEASVLGVVLRSISQGSSNRSTQSNQRSTSAPQGMASDRSSSTGRDTCKGASISPILIDPRPSSVRRTSDPNVSSAAIDRATITPLVCSHGHVHLEDMHNTGPVAARWSPYMAVRGVHRSTRKRRRGPIKYSRPALRRMVLPNSHRIRHHHLPFTPAIHHTRNAPTPDRDGPPHPGGAAAVMGGDDSFVGRMVEGGVSFRCLTLMLCCGRMGWAGCTWGGICIDIRRSQVDVERSHSPYWGSGRYTCEKAPGRAVGTRTGLDTLLSPSHLIPVTHTQPRGETHIGDRGRHRRRLGVRIIVQSMQSWGGGVWLRKSHASPPPPPSLLPLTPRPTPPRPQELTHTPTPTRTRHDSTMSTFWNSAGARVNRAKLAQQVVPTIAANMVRGGVDGRMGGFRSTVIGWGRGSIMRAERHSDSELI